MTQAEIEELRRLDRACPGEWSVVVNGLGQKAMSCGGGTETIELGVAARNALPKLLREREQLIQALRQIAARAEPYMGAAAHATIAGVEL